MTTSDELQDLFGRFNQLLQKASEAGFRVDGARLAKGFLTKEVLARMESLVFNDEALVPLKKKATRIEFITEGTLSPELLEEPSLKKEPVFKQLIGYGLCKACRLCIQVCPKHVYRDDGFGRPDRDHRREWECTGGQCNQCVDICPEHTIQVALADPVFKSTLFLLLPGLKTPPAVAESNQDFLIRNPLEGGAPLKISGKPDPHDLNGCHRLFDAAHFHPVLELKGYPRHFVDSQDPEADLRCWATENGRQADLALKAIRLLYDQLYKLTSLKQGKYRLDEILHRIIDEILHQGIEPTRSGGRALLASIVREAWIEEPFLGAKLRPIGGLLPTGTSLAWKTPYGEEIPDYAHLEKCLGPECGLCVTQCPEGGGGSHSAIRMVLKVPQGMIPWLVRGLGAFLLRLDGTHSRTENIEDLTGQTPFVFEVDPDYCKSCGICITCCPHDVIEPTLRLFDLRKTAT